MSNKIKEIIKNFLMSLFLGLVISSIIIQIISVVTVEDNSMLPTINDGSILVLNKISCRFNLPERGDIVVINIVDSDTGNNRMIVKRVIGLPGERLQISNGYVFINGKILEEPYIVAGFTDGDMEIEIGKDQIFFLGDNRPYSDDSRVIGTVSKYSIYGKVIYDFYPSKNKKNTNYKQNTNSLKLYEF